MSRQDRDSVDRRQFLKTAALGGAAMTAGIASASRHSTSETLVAQLYQSLSAEQKSKVAFAFDDPLRSKVDNNWHITPVRIKDFFSPDQQAMISEIFHGLHNPEFVDKVLYHIRDDAGGLGEYAVALFGEPGAGAFEFVLTGRHCTVRCDGDSVEGAAFGGPIFYGHAAGSFNESAGHPNNVYWYQAVRANEVFQALDGKQRAAALLGEARAEKATATVRLEGSRDDLAGLPVSEMSADQRKLVDHVLSDLLLPFRKADRDEAMKLIRSGGGIEALSMSFYKNHDIGNDGVWDVWQLESPSMIWYFRGAPHVHTWVNIRQPA